MQSGHGARFVQRLDRNRDGKVSRTEFDGPPNHFNHLDRDRDGYLSEDEAPPSPPMGIRSGGFPRPPANMHPRRPGAARRER